MVVVYLPHRVVVEDLKYSLEQCLPHRVAMAVNYCMITTTSQFHFCLPLSLSSLTVYSGVLFSEELKHST